MGQEDHDPLWTRNEEACVLVVLHGVMTGSVVSTRLVSSRVLTCAEGIGYHAEECPAAGILFFLSASAARWAGVAWLIRGIELSPICDSERRQ